MKLQCAVNLSTGSATISLPSRLVVTGMAISSASLRTLTGTNPSLYFLKIKTESGELYSPQATTPGTETFAWSIAFPVGAADYTFQSQDANRPHISDRCSSPTKKLAISIVNSDGTTATAAEAWFVFDIHTRSAAE